MTWMSVLGVSGNLGCVNSGRRRRLVINAGGTCACGVAHKEPSMPRRHAKDAPKGRQGGGGTEI